MIIQLADRSNAYPRGVVEDVLVKVNELVFPVDFYILDMEDKSVPCSTPVLLWRPFLKTARTKIDVHEGTLTMEFDGELNRFNIFEAMRYPSDVQSIYAIDVVDSLSQQVFDFQGDDILEMALREEIKQDVYSVSEEIENVMATLNSFVEKPHTQVSYVKLPVTYEKMQPSIVKPPSLE